MPHAVYIGNSTTEFSYSHSYQVDDQLISNTNTESRVDISNLVTFIHVPNEFTDIGILISLACKHIDRVATPDCYDRRKQIFDWLVKQYPKNLHYAIRLGSSNNAYQYGGVYPVISGYIQTITGEVRFHDITNVRQAFFYVTPQNNHLIDVLQDQVRSASGSYSRTISKLIERLDQTVSAHADAANAAVDNTYKRNLARFSDDCRSLVTHSDKTLALCLLPYDDFRTTGKTYERINRFVVGDNSQQQCIVNDAPGWFIYPRVYHKYSKQLARFVLTNGPYTDYNAGKRAVMEELYKLTLAESSLDNVPVDSKESRYAWYNSINDSMDLCALRIGNTNDVTTQGVTYIRKNKQIINNERDNQRVEFYDRTWFLYPIEHNKYAHTLSEYFKELKQRTPTASTSNIKHELYNKLTELVEPQKTEVKLQMFIKPRPDFDQTTYDPTALISNNYSLADIYYTEATPWVISQTLKGVVSVNVDCSVTNDTLINGISQSQIDDNQLIEYIVQQELIIAQLDTITSKSAAIAKLRIKHTNNIAKLVEVLDGR
jgi:hypothetical protein